eukprot:11215796-Alexandrium_andersonii.AAC.1
MDTVAIAPSEMTAKPSFPEASVRRSLQPPGQGALHVQHYLFCCACGAAALHLRWPGCTCASAAQ